MTKEISGILNAFLKEYSDRISTLEECSFDSTFNHGEGMSLVDSKYRCYDFDSISGTLWQSKGYEKLQSVDSILPVSPSGGQKLYLIEFKNCRKKGNGIIPYQEVRGKILDTLLLFKHFYHLKESEFKDIITITVHYSSDKNKKNLANMRNHFKKNIGSNYDEVENFKILKDMYGIVSYKLNAEDFVKFIEEHSLVC